MNTQDFGRPVQGVGETRPARLKTGRPLLAFLATLRRTNLIYWEAIFTETMFHLLQSK